MTTVRKNEEMCRLPHQVQLDARNSLVAIPIVKSKAALRLSWFCFGVTELSLEGKEIDWSIIRRHKCTISHVHSLMTHN